HEPRLLRHGNIAGPRGQNTNAATGMRSPVSGAMDSRRPRHVSQVNAELWQLSRQAIGSLGTQATNQRPPGALHEGTCDGEHLLIRLCLREDDLWNAFARLAAIVRAGVPIKITAIQGIPVAACFPIHALSPGLPRRAAFPTPTREAWCTT